MKSEKTHPWINFRLSLTQADYRLWLQLGEVTSKIQHLGGVPLKPSFAKTLHEIFLARGALATTAIEGNTLSEDQVKAQIQGDLKLPPSQEYLQQEVQNILDLCNREVQLQLNQSSEKPQLCVDLIKDYNRGVMKKLKVDEGVIPGVFRDHSVIVGNVYRGAPAEDCPRLMERLCTWLNGADFEAPDNELRTTYALLRAIMAHLYLAWIHPFGDGNGRAARMLEFHILFSSGIPLPAAHLLSDHYNKTRTQYYRELDYASKSNGDVIPFIRYALQGFLDGIREQIGLVREQQLHVAWENHIFEKFRPIKSSPTQKRRRDLVLELSKHDWLPIAKVEELSPSLAREYFTSGNRMVGRDLNAIAKMGLIDRKRGKVRARVEVIQAFLPGCVSPAE